MPERLPPVRVVPRAVDRFSSTLTFSEQRAHPMWCVQKGYEDEDEDRAASEITKIAREVAHTLSNPYHAVSIRRPALGETIILEGGEKSISVWRQYDREEAKEDGIQVLGHPRVSMALRTGSFSFEVTTGGEENKPFFEDHVTSETAGQEGYLLSVGEIQRKIEQKYRYEGGLVHIHRRSKTLDPSGYKNAHAAIDQTVYELKRGVTNKHGLYFESVSDDGEYVTFKQIDCKNVQIVEELTANIKDPVALVAFANGWQFRQMDSHRFHLPL